MGDDNLVEFFYFQFRVETQLNIGVMSDMMVCRQPRLVMIAGSKISGVSDVMIQCLRLEKFLSESANNQ